MVTRKIPPFFAKNMKKHEKEKHGQESTSMRFATIYS